MSTEPIIRYAIDAEDRICFVDEGWRRFAQANDGEELVGPSTLGRSIWDGISDPTTRALYQQIVARVRQGRSARFTLRCDGPGCRRLLEMTISLAPDGSVLFETQALRVTEREPVDLLSRRATRSTTLLRACAWCNRIDAGFGTDDWVDVEEAVERLRLFEAEQMPRVTHGICGSCLASMERTLEDMETDPGPGAAADG